MNQLGDAVAVLKRGGIVLYPTDTVYGLGVDATNIGAVELLKELKGGDNLWDKKYLITVSDLDMAQQYATISPLAEKVAARFLPGKVSLVLSAKDLPDALTGGTGTVGVRIPNHPVALELVRTFGKPITSTSANLTGRPVMGTVSEMLAQLGEKGIAIYYHSAWPAALPASAPSTIIDVRTDTPILIREGAVSFDELTRTLG